MAAPITNIASGISLDNQGNIKKKAPSTTAGLVPSNLNLGSYKPPSYANSGVASGIGGVAGVVPNSQPSGQYATARPAPTAGLMGTSYGPQQQTPQYQVQGGPLQTPQQDAPQQPQTPTKGLLTYPGLVGGIADASKPTDTQTKLVGDLGNKNSGQDLKTATGNLATQIGLDRKYIQDIYGQAIPLEFQQGRAQVAQLAQQQKEAGLQGIVNNLLTGRGQDISAQGTALGGANTQQGQTLSGLGSAAGYAQPSGNFPFVFDPLTGGFKSPGVGGGAQGGPGQMTYDPAKDSHTLAQQVMNHQISYQDALTALSYGSNGSAAAGQLTSAILAAGGNPSILQTQAQIQNDQEVQSQAYTSAHQQATNLQSQLTDLITKFGLNPSDLNLANSGLQAIAKNTSDSRYQLLFNYMADVASRYSQILTPPGGSATDTTRSVATGMINGVASGQSIINVLHGLDQQAQAVSAGVKTIGPGANGGSPAPQSGAAGTSAFSEAW